MYIKQVFCHCNHFLYCTGLMNIFCSRYLLLTLINKQEILKIRDSLLLIVQMPHHILKLSRQSLKLTVQTGGKMINTLWSENMSNSFLCDIC